MLGIILVVTLLRFWVGSQVGLGDVEAYYWTWSRHPAPGYFDHGPVVALLIRGGTWLFGQTTLGVRALFILLSGLTMWLVARLVMNLVQLSGDRTEQGAAQAGLWAVIALLAMPVFMVAGGAANPDVPFLACVAGFTLCVMPARCSGGRLALAGLLCGVAFSTKYFGLALLAPLVYASLQHRFRSLVLPLAAAAATLGASPVLYWNGIHGWASFGYHLARRHTQPPGPSLENLAKLIGGQVGYLSPLVLLGLGAAAMLLWRERRSLRNRVFLLVSAPLLAVGYLLILVVPGAEPHWPVAGYLPLVAVLGAHLPGLLRRSRITRGLTMAALTFSAVVALAFHLHILTDLGVRLMPASYVPRYDLSNELRGWPEVAREVERQLHSNPGTVAAACHYTSCSQLRFAAAGRFEVLCPSPRLSQMDFFPGGDGSSRRGVNLLYLKDERFPYDAEVLYRCGSVTRQSEIRIWRAHRLVRRFQLQLCREFSGLRAATWPPRGTIGGGG